MCVFNVCFLLFRCCVFCCCLVGVFLFFVCLFVFFFCFEHACVCVCVCERARSYVCVFSVIAFSFILFCLVTCLFCCSSICAVFVLFVVVTGFLCCCCLFFLVCLFVCLFLPCALLKFQLFELLYSLNFFLSIDIEVDSDMLLILHLSSSFLFRLVCSMLMPCPLSLRPTST